MKQTLSLLALLLLSIQTQAQFKIGTHTGVDINNIRITGIPEALTDVKQNTSFATFGVHGSYGFTPEVSLKAELNFSKKGFEISETFEQNILGLNIPIGIKARTSLSVIESPILISYSKPAGHVNLFAEAGPVFSYTTTGKVEPLGAFGLDFNLPDVALNFNQDGYNRLGVGAAIGIGVEKSLSNEISVFGRTRYTHSFTDILDNPIVNIRTRANTVHLGAGLSYRF